MELKNGYKQTEAGVIPDDWELTPIDELFSFIGGSQPPRHTFVFTEKQGYVRLIQIRDYKTDKYASYIPEYLSKRNCTANDIMIGRYGPPIFQILNGLEGSYNVALIKAVPTPKLIKKFGWYLLTQQKLFDFVDKLSQRSSGQTGVDLNELKKYLIPLPPTREEQAAIATALSDSDALISRLESLIAKKRAIKQGAMQQLLKPKEGWEVKKLGEIGVFSKGQGIRKDESLSGDIPCVRYGEIYTSHNDYIKEFRSFISRHVAQTSKRLKVGDILFAGSGETKEEIGKAVSFVQNIEAYAGGDIVILSPYSANSTFLGYLLNTPFVVKQKASRGQGDAVVHISANNLADVVIYLPSTIKQQAIAQILSDMDAEIAGLEQKLAKYKLVKQGMMQELLTGKTRLV